MPDTASVGVSIESGSNEACVSRMTSSGLGAVGARIERFVGNGSLDAEHLRQLACRTDLHDDRSFRVPFKGREDGFAFDIANRVSDATRPVAFHVSAFDPSRNLELVRAAGGKNWGAQLAHVGQGQWLGWGSASSRRPTRLAAFGSRVRALGMREYDLDLHGLEVHVGRTFDDPVYRFDATDDHECIVFVDSSSGSAEYSTIISTGGKTKRISDGYAPVLVCKTRTNDFIYINEKHVTIYDADFRESKVNLGAVGKIWSAAQSPDRGEIAAIVDTGKSANTLVIFNHERVVLDLTECGSCRWVRWDPACLSLGHGNKHFIYSASSLREPDADHRDCLTTSWSQPNIAAVGGTRATFPFAVVEYKYINNDVVVLSGSGEVGRPELSVWFLNRV